MRETAEALGISLSAAKARLFHAKKALRRSAIKLVDQPRFAGKLAQDACRDAGVIEEKKVWFRRPESTNGLKVSRTSNSLDWFRQPCPSALCLKILLRRNGGVGGYDATRMYATKHSQRRS